MRLSLCLTKPGMGRKRGEAIGDVYPFGRTRILFEHHQLVTLPA